MKKGKTHTLASAPPPGAPSSSSSIASSLSSSSKSPSLGSGSSAWDCNQSNAGCNPLFLVAFNALVTFASV